MDEQKLKTAYRKANKERLGRVFEESLACSAQGERLISKASLMQRNIVHEIQRRLREINDTPRMLAQAQIEEISKQWSYCAASSVNVKRAIRLYGLHKAHNTEKILDLYISPKYGIKEHKRCRRYNPFHYYSFATNRTKAILSMRGDALASVSTSGIETLDFGVMRNIPQLDFEKIDELIELTHDAVNMWNSWANFYDNSEDLSRAYKINQLKKIMDMSYVGDEDDFVTIIKDIDELVKFKKTLAREMTVQAARWAPVILKWKEANKNYLVLNELANIDVKI